MYCSIVIAESLIGRIQAEADFSPAIETQAYIDWLNALEGRLYSEIIRESRAGVCNVSVENGAFVLYPNTIDVRDSEEAAEYALGSVRPSDVISVTFDGTVHERSGGRIAQEIPGNRFYQRGGQIVLTTLRGTPVTVDVLYIVRPRLKTQENLSQTYIMLPDEFVPLAEAYLRAEAYKVANEDTLAAKWAGEYNSHLQNFMYWLAKAGGGDGK